MLRIDPLLQALVHLVLVAPMRILLFKIVSKYTAVRKNKYPQLITLSAKNKDALQTRLKTLCMAFGA